eukprot:3601289-Pyramimonas_sp.AAC.1
MIVSPAPRRPTSSAERTCRLPLMCGSLARRKIRHVRAEMRLPLATLTNSRARTFIFQRMTETELYRTRLLS